MTRRVVITGTGVISPLGDARAALHQALCEGRSGLKPVQGFEAVGIERPLAGEIPSFQAADYVGSRGLRPLNRTAQLLTAAAHLALEDSGWTAEMLAEHEVGLVTGTMFCSAHTISEFDVRAMKEGPSRASPLDFANTVINAAAGQAALWHKLTGLNSTISAGTTSGVQSLAYAFDMIRNGHAGALLAGGVEELCYETLYGFFNSGMLCISPGQSEPRPIPFDSRRNGFCLAEGSALLMLEEAEAAAARGANVLGELKGHGSAFDYQLRAGTNGDVEAGAEAMARAIQIALDDAGITAADIDALSASANGSPWVDRVEAAGMGKALNGQAATLPVTAIKSMIGESLGASGAMQTVAMVQAMHDGRLPGVAGLEEIEHGLPLEAVTSQTTTQDVNHGLINAMGSDGNCCALVIGR